MNIYEEQSLTPAITVILVNNSSCGKHCEGRYLKASHSTYTACHGNRLWTLRNTQHQLNEKSSHTCMCTMSCYQENACACAHAPVRIHEHACWRVSQCVIHVPHHLEQGLCHYRIYCKGNWTRISYHKCTKAINTNIYTQNRLLPDRKRVQISLL